MRPLFIALLMCGLLIPSAAGETGALAEAEPPTVYSLAYRADLYVVEAGVAREITYAEWEQWGFPAPLPAATAFVKYAWSPTIYALTRWSAPESSWQWDQLTYPQWQRAGFPGPQAVAWIAGSSLYKWATAPDVGVIAPDGSRHWLSEVEWAAMGYPRPDYRTNEGFIKLSWDPTIARITDLAAWSGYPIGWAEWQAENYPTPKGYSRIPGDQFTRYSGSATIYYAGLTANRAITYAEWAAAGYPAPTVVSPNVDCARVACVALTFDDGPSPYTDRLIGSLKSLEVPATFFVVGQQVTSQPSVVRNEAAAGLRVENHSFTHPELNSLSYSSQLAEIQRTDDALSAAGVARSTMLRPPYGAWNADTRRLGKPLILWSVDPRDWDGKTSAEIRSHVRTYARAGDIVLMHDRVSATVDAVPGIIADLRAKGLTLVTVDTLIPNLKPGDIAYSRTNIVRSTTSLDAPAVTRDGSPVVDEAPFIGDAG